MKLRTAISSLLLCLAPFVAAGQATTGEPSVVWRLSPDGDWLAAVRAEPHAASDGALLLAPLHPQPAGTQIIGLMPLEPTRRVQAGLSLSADGGDAATPSFCSGLAGVMGVVPPGSDCAGGGDAPLPRFDRAQSGVLWSATPSFSAALNYGVSEQSGGVDPAQFGNWSLDSALGVGTLFPIPGMAGSGRDVSLAGSWRVSPTASLVLSGTLGEYALRSPGLGPFDVDQAAVQFGLRYGRFTGGITGRVVRSGAPNALGEFSGLDIGVSWRTPWQGEFAVGARNVISRGSDALLPDPDAALEEATARTPYVRYKQDL